MEKYIKVLENYIDEYIEPYIFENDNYDELDEMREAIEKLIKAYKELERENQILENKNKLKEIIEEILRCNQIEREVLVEKINERYISKYKIRKKINELIDKDRKARSATTRLGIQGGILALQELLEE